MARPLLTPPLHIGRAHGGLQRQRPESRLRHCCNPSPLPRTSKGGHLIGGRARQWTYIIAQSHRNTAGMRAHAPLLQDDEAHRVLQQKPRPQHACIPSTASRKGKAQRDIAGEAWRWIDYINQRHWEAAARRPFASAPHIGRAHGGLQWPEPRLRHHHNPSPLPRTDRARHPTTLTARQWTRFVVQSCRGAVGSRSSTPLTPC